LHTVFLQNSEVINAAGFGKDPLRNTVKWLCFAGGPDTLE